MKNKTCHSFQFLIIRDRGIFVQFFFFFQLFVRSSCKKKAMALHVLRATSFMLRVKYITSHWIGRRKKIFIVRPTFFLPFEIALVQSSSENFHSSYLIVQF